MGLPGLCCRPGFAVFLRAEFHRCPARSTHPIVTVLSLRKMCSIQVDRQLESHMVTDKQVSWANKLASLSGLRAHGGATRLQLRLGTMARPGIQVTRNQLVGVRPTGSPVRRAHDLCLPGHHKALSQSNPKIAPELPLNSWTLSDVFRSNTDVMQKVT